MVSFFLILFATFLIADLMWWRWADARLRPLRFSRLCRALLGSYIGAMVLFVVGFVILPRQMRLPHAWVPVWYLALVYVWHLFVLPATLVLFIPGKLIETIMKTWKRLRPASEPSQMPVSANESTFTRRQLLAAATVAAPPLFATGAVAYSMRKLHHFRVRPMTIPLRNLPAALDGLTIAHLSDVHIGKFTDPPMLREIVARANSLRCDLVFFTGDLIDNSLAALPDGIDLLRNLDPRLGFVIIEGNHDLIDDRDEFEQRMRLSGLPFLLDQSRTIEIRGQKVQVLGQRWNRGASAIAQDTQGLLDIVGPDAFPILLAHHPHAWDTARDQAGVKRTRATPDSSIPLTLSGHTHGGQLMLNERLGAGPVMFKYWSGLYQRDDSALVVSNGIGNWFPLRIHAQAEIVHITLRRA